MAISFKCACGRHYRVDDQFAGRPVQCRACGQKMTIPAATSADAGEIGLAPDDDPLPAAAEMQRRVAPQPQQPACVPPRPLPLPPPIDDPPESLSVRLDQAPQRKQRGTIYDPSRARPIARKQTGSGVSWKSKLASTWVILALLGGAVKIYKTLSGTRSPGQTTAMSSSGRSNGGRSQPASARPIVAEAGLRRPTMALVEGVLRGRITIQGDSARQSVWVYLPAGSEGAAASLPCVLVAAAGGSPVSGKALGESDAAEHIPYAKAGFAVIAYDVAGEMGENNAEQAIRAFMAADGGVRDARRALANAQAIFPEIDSARVYSAGHSSAGTLSLMLAARNLVGGAVAYAPVADPASMLDAQTLRELESVFPNIHDFLKSHSPRYNPAECPILVVHSKTDEVVPFAQSRDHTPASEKKFITLESGSHYDSMISRGLAEGVNWLQEKASPQAPPAATPSTPTNAQGSLQ